MSRQLGGHVALTVVLDGSQLGHEQAVEGHVLLPAALGHRLVGALHIRHLARAGRQQVAHGQHVRRPWEGHQLALGLLQRRGHLCARTWAPCQRHVTTRLPQFEFA